MRFGGTSGRFFPGGRHGVSGLTGSIRLLFAGRGGRWLAHPFLLLVGRRALRFRGIGPLAWSGGIAWRVRSVRFGGRGFARFRLGTFAGGGFGRFRTVWLVGRLLAGSLLRGTVPLGSRVVGLADPALSRFLRFGRIGSLLGGSISGGLLARLRSVGRIGLTRVSGGGTGQRIGRLVHPLVRFPSGARFSAGSGGFVRPGGHIVVTGTRLLLRLRRVAGWRGRGGGR